MPKQKRIEMGARITKKYLPMSMVNFILIEMKNSKPQVALKNRNHSARDCTADDVFLFKRSKRPKTAPHDRIRYVMR